MRALGLAIALSTAPVPAMSDQNLSAFELLDACGRTSEAWVSFCHGYIQAVYDTSTLAGVYICPPEGTTRAAMAQTVYEGLLFLSTQTGIAELEQADGASLSATIMADQFPCD